MSILIIKTKAQQKLEHFENLKRPLTPDESEDLRRSMHAVYAYEWKNQRLAQHRNEELKLLNKLRKEAMQPSTLG